MSASDVSTASWCFLGQKGVEAVDGGVGAVVEEAAVAGEGESDAVVAGPFGDFADIAAGRGRLPRIDSRRWIGFDSQRRRPAESDTRSISLTWSRCRWLHSPPLG
jgi:hypothetical protein